MKILEFEEIKGGMSVLYKKEKEIYATKVVSTSYGHPSVEMVTLQGGFIVYYNADYAFDSENELKINNVDKTIYADSALNRTELLLESETILTDLNTE